jgi:NAD(P)H-dependent flavin oxidoreductase YrpB (nitropropane dioxygenase family)
MKLSIDLASMQTADWAEYVNLCGWALARAHARTGDSARIAGYLGKADQFDAAMARFAAHYADQTERDHAALLRAIRSGRLPAEPLAT